MSVKFNMAMSIVDYDGEYVIVTMRATPNVDDCQDWEYSYRRNMDTGYKELVEQSVRVFKVVQNKTISENPNCKFDGLMIDSSGYSLKISNTEYSVKEKHEV